MGAIQVQEVATRVLGVCIVYTDQYDRMIAEVEDKTKCVYDTIMWKYSIKNCFF